LPLPEIHACPSNVLNMTFKTRERRIRSRADREAEAELFRRMAPRIRLYGLRHFRDAAAARLICVVFPYRGGAR
jgi:hypothetical protein